VKFNTDRGLDTVDKAQNNAERFEITGNISQIIDKKDAGSSTLKATLIKSTAREGKLKYYDLMTKSSVVEERIRPQEQIIEHINKILGFLESLKDILSEPMEIEIAFSNIIEHHKELWDSRSLRERPFLDVLVSLESCIKHYDATEFNIAKLDTLMDVYSSLKTENLLTSFSQDCRKKLRKAGFDLEKALYVEPAKEFLKKIMER
jgi:hypothetical protein